MKIDPDSNVIGQIAGSFAGSSGQRLSTNLARCTSAKFSGMVCPFFLVLISAWFFFIIGFRAGYGASKPRSNKQALQRLFSGFGATPHLKQLSGPPAGYEGGIVRG
jgi:hypothetical protein